MIPIAKPYLTQDEAQAAYDTILTGWITQGPRVAEFEEKFAEYTGSRFAVAVSSCTTALHLSMIVSDIGPDDEVICPSMSYIATANSIRYVGAIPVFAEVDPDTFNINLIDAEKKITSKTKAILIVHQIGMPAEIDAFARLCAKYQLKLIEDAACAIGSTYNDRRIGCHSELVCFSFHPRKVISTGDGGMITTPREDYYLRLKQLRQHGMSVDDRIRHESNKTVFENYAELGYNYRMTDIQAAVGIQQLKKLDWIVQERRKIAHHYIQGLKEIECIRFQHESENCVSNYQSFSLYLDPMCPISRNFLIDKLLEKGIATRRGVMTAHREVAYMPSGQSMTLPASEEASDRSILIPLYIPMSLEEIDYIIETIKAVLKAN